jgi:hypothetical protein
LKHAEEGPANLFLRLSSSGIRDPETGRRVRRLSDQRA